MQPKTMTWSIIIHHNLQEMWMIKSILSPLHSKINNKRNDQRERNIYLQGYKRSKGRDLQSQPQVSNLSLQLYITVYHVTENSKLCGGGEGLQRMPFYGIYIYGKAAKMGQYYLEVEHTFFFEYALHVPSLGSIYRAYWKGPF